MKTYKASVWIHHKNGGDDTNYQMEIPAKNIDEARAEIKSFIKLKRSVIEDDYHFIGGGIYK